jgi:hypothetical protein
MACEQLRRRALRRGHAVDGIVAAFAAEDARRLTA